MPSNLREARSGFIGRYLKEMMHKGHHLVTLENDEI
jgi:hypothetical protein